MNNSEDILRTAINNIQEASFSKASLEALKKYPKTLQPFFISGNDNEKILATQVYVKLLEKFGSFSREIKNKRITPNEEELNSCEEVIDAVFDSSKDLLRDVPEIANAIRIREIQSVLSDLKSVVQRMKSENQNSPNNFNNDKSYLGVITFMVICGIAVIGII